MVIFIKDSRIHGRRRREDIPSLDLKPEAFVSFLENHDQVSNSATGDRLRLQTSPGRYRAMTALLLLGPWTPLLFQGEEFGASTPFLYFSEVGDEKLREAIKKGRFEFLAQFPSAASARSDALPCLTKSKPFDAASSIGVSAKEITRFLIYTAI